MIDSVLFVGLGAVGAIYAQLAIQSTIPCYALVTDPEVYRKTPVMVNGKVLYIPFLSEADLSEKIDLIIIAVKSYHLDRVIRQIGNCISRKTIILSLLNGVASEEKIRAAFPQACVLDAFCSGIDSNREGHRITMNRRGKIVFGDAEGKNLSQLAELSAYFAMTGIPFETVPDIQRQMWWKLMVNVGMNQVSAVRKLTYGEFRNDPDAMAQMHAAQREVIQIANAQGIYMDESDIMKWDWQLSTLSSEGYSSTLQDVLAKRKTEVELYGGEICRRAACLGISTPVNAELHRQICEMEKSYL